MNRNEQESCQVLTDDCNIAYKDYHSFIINYFRSQFDGSNSVHSPSLNSTLAQPYQQGLLIDIHGQTHPEERIELGYYINPADLNKPLVPLSNTLNNTINKLRQLNGNKFSVDEIIRGANVSLGGILLKKFGLKACPSPTENPGTSKYFRGGFTVQTYGSYYASKFNMNAIQIELPSSMRQTANYSVYGLNIASAIYDFYFIHSLENLLL